MAATFRHVVLLFLAALGLAVVGMLSDDPTLVVSALVAFVTALGLWRILHKESFLQFVVWPARSTRRRRKVYLRDWEPALAITGLTVEFDGVRHVPRLVRVRSTASVDQVTVQPVTGQIAEDYAAVAERLAATFGASECRVRTHPQLRNRLVLWFVTRDPLAQPVAPFAQCDPPDLSGLPVARREDGLVYRLRLLGTHLLLVGATNAGKSSVVWALIHALSPGVKSGLVSLWVIDPKGGMELAPGQPLFTRFHPVDNAGCDEAAHEIGYAVLLEDAVQLMRERQAALRGVSRLHHPTPDEPLIVLIIDELAALTSYVTGRDAKRRISAALSLLLSQGRAVGVSVVAALQDPRKEVLPARDLFPTRIGLRMVDSDQVDMVLGAGARARGAKCDQISESLPGVGYVGLDGVPEPIRVRFAYLADGDVAVMAREFRPGTEDEDCGFSVDEPAGLRDHPLGCEEIERVCGDAA